MAMAVAAGDLREYLRERISYLRGERQVKNVKHELRMACAAFVHITELETQKVRKLKLVKKRKRRVA